MRHIEAAGRSFMATELRWEAARGLLRSRDSEPGHGQTLGEPVTRFFAHHEAARAGAQATRPLWGNDK